MYLFTLSDPNYSDGDQLDGPEMQQVPSILFNKYALDRDESRRSKLWNNVFFFLFFPSNFNKTFYYIIVDEILE